MGDHLEWQYDEFKQVGKDYGMPEEVEVYDSSHASFRNIEQENNRILDSLGIGGNHVVIEFGTGTGTFAIQAALRGAKVYAVDVSRAMLEYAEAKAKVAGVSKIVFCHGGFLTFEHEGPPVDFIVSTYALHHLPDLWKGIALDRLYQMLKPNGRLYIHDAIIEKQHAIENIEALIEKLAAVGGSFLREDTEGHFREEFSTYDWVMDGLLLRSGFTINNKTIRDGVIGTYYCTRD